jgi:hypothetical protein
MDFGWLRYTQYISGDNAPVKETACYCESTRRSLAPCNEAPLSMNMGR